MTPIPIPGFADPFSALSHLAAGALALVLLPLLVARGRDSAGRMLSISVYAFSVVFLLSMSGVYHLLPPTSEARGILRILDHSAIFALIAGTFTPVHTIIFRGIWRWGMLALVWTMAIAAITSKAVMFSSIPEWLSLLLYLGMGWMGLISGVALARRFGWRFILPLLVGAGAYTLGAVIDFIALPVLIPGVLGPHELFHVAVIIGIASHWRFVRAISPGYPAAEVDGTMAWAHAANPAPIARRHAP